MRLNGFNLLEGIPRIGLIVGIPIAAFIVTIGLTLARNGSGDTQAQAPTTIGVALQRSLTTPTPAVTPTPAPTVVPYRTSCADINGTAYRSDDERAWFIANCDGPRQRTATATTAQSGGAPAGGSAAPVSRIAVETSSGDRLVIQKIGVNTPISRTSVGPEGVMPDPVGYDNAVLYNFPSHPGLGGDPLLGGNAVLAGHVDCGRCRNGGPGLAVFYHVRNLVAGDVMEYYGQGGQYIRYTITYAGDLSPNADWAAVVATGAADITIITCTGSFSGGEYSHRRVVQARKS